MAEQATQVATQEVTQQPAVEGVKEAVVEQPKETGEELKAKRFAELSKKEQRILRKQIELNKQLKEREEGLTRREAEIKEAAKRELRELAKTNPTKALEELQTNYKSITDYILNEGKPTPEAVQTYATSEVEKLRQEIEGLKKSQQEREAQKAQEENQRILQNFNASIVEYVKTNADKYPAVNTFDGSPVIYEMIQQRWHDTKGQHLMTPEEAAGVLEGHLGELVEKLLQSPKYASRVAHSKEEPKQQSLNKPKTITNELTPSSPSLLSAKTEADRIKRAMEKLG